jgi:sporulation protein YlmC with PRC-barrel domain
MPFLGILKNGFAILPLVVFTHEGAQTTAVLGVEDLLREPVRTESGEMAGEIQRLILDPERGSIRLVVVDLVGPEPRTVAVPWSFISVGTDGTVWLRGSEEELLTSPSFPEVAEGSSPARRPGESAFSQQLTYAPENEVVRFDPARVTSYRGVVVGTMTAPLEGSIDVLVAIVDVGDREVQAHLGSRDYLELIECDLEPGDSVAFEGSPQDEEGTTVVAVSRITVQGRSFRLKNSDGSKPPTP